MFAFWIEVMIMKNLTKRQQETLSYVTRVKSEKGYMPTIREISEALNLKSTSSAFAHLQALEKKGYVKRDPTKPRALEIIPQIRRELIEIPVIGTVAAGTPILAHQNIEEYFPVPYDMLHGRTEVFMLHVKGDSMINANICNGDYLMVEQKDTAENGEIIVALIDDSATVKRFFREDGYCRLQPENDFMEPIIVKDVKILGKAIGVMRRF